MSKTQIKLPKINGTNRRIEIAEKLEKNGHYNFSSKVKCVVDDGLVFVVIDDNEYYMTWDAFTHLFLAGNEVWRRSATKKLAKRL